MATFLDLSLLEHVSSVFTFLFLFVIIYALLQLSKIFKSVSGHQGLYAIIALTFAFLGSFSDALVGVLTTMVPWFTIILIFLFLSFFVMRMFTTDDKFFENIGEQPAMKWVLIIVFLIILISSISSSFGQSLLEGTSGSSSESTDLVPEPVTIPSSTGISSSDNKDFGDNVLQTFFHPKVLGLILIMLIAFFTVLLIAKTPEPS